jgi:flagellar biosynthetic protein FliP
VFGALAALCITAGVMILALRMLGRLQGVAPRSAQAGSLQLLDRVSTGPRQGVVLLRAGARVLIVGVGETHTLLGELSAEEITELERGSARPAVRQLSAAPWRATLSRLGLVVALMVLPLGLSAQTVTSPPPSGAASATSTAPPSQRTPTVRAPTPPTMDVRLGDGAEELRLSGAVGVVVFMGAMTLLPAVFMLMTGFTRILIVLSFLRSALGTQGAPPTQLLVAIAIILTSVVMQPTLTEANRDALQPYLRGEIGQVEAYRAAVVPMRKFMLANTRDKDLGAFAELSAVPDSVALEDLPTATVMSAFVTSELRTAFQMGFIIFLPFLVIDLIVASVLMSMGMFMLPPVLVSLPFKLLLFVLADGWMLVMQNLVASFRSP